MSKPFYKGRLSINKEKSSPYWMVTFQGPDGKMKRRSTKVPVNGGSLKETASRPSWRNGSPTSGACR